MKNIKYTMAQALVKWLAAQSVRQLNGEILPAFAGVWAIFGHGNVAGLGEALSQYRGELPTFRGHNEQGMAHAAIAFAKQKARRQFMAVTSSIGPGATNMVTAAALAHVNRLPVLFLPGDVLLIGGQIQFCSKLKVFQMGISRQMIVSNPYQGILIG